MFLLTLLQLVTGNFMKPSIRAGGTSGKEMVRGICTHSPKPQGHHLPAHRPPLRAPGFYVWVKSLSILLWHLPLQQMLVVLRWHYRQWIDLYSKCLQVMSEPHVLQLGHVGVHLWTWYLVLVSRSLGDSCQAAVLWQSVKAALWGPQTSNLLALFSTWCQRFESSVLLPLLSFVCPSLLASFLSSILPWSNLASTCCIAKKLRLTFNFPSSCEAGSI